MNELKDWAALHPLLALVAIFSICAIGFVVFKFVFNDYTSAGAGELTVEKPEDPELTRLTILASDGKVIEEFDALRGSIRWDEDTNPSIRFDTKEKEDIVYLLGNFSVKMVDL